MNTKENFSQYIKKDELGQHHIRVGYTTYVVEAKKVFNQNTGKNDYHLIKINYQAKNGDICPVSQDDLRSKNWLITALQNEIRKEAIAAYNRYKAAESSNQYHQWKSQQRRKHGMNRLGGY